MLINNLAFSALLATAAASAIPAIKAAPLNKRSEVTWDQNGNLKLTCTFLKPRLAHVPLLTLHRSLLRVC